ncbi:MAG: polyphosphate polymerase domain-containing protein [Faecalicoccus sp.]|nr:polyphosphate polymerase domain-containing protein [Faecalicoccus sp.]
MERVIDTFERVEDKYELSESQYQLFLKAIQDHVHPDIYYKYTVHSIYFDNDHYQLAVNSLQKPEYKCKVRLRTYEQPNKDSKCFLELKKKYNDIVYKTRFYMDVNSAYRYLYENVIPEDSNNIMRELNYVFHYYDLHNFCYVQYDRECYAANEDADVRITFDTNIRYRLDDISLSTKGSEIDLIPEDTHMLEIKCKDRYPLWLVEILSKMKLYKKSFSKCGSIYVNNFEYLTKGGIARV